MKWTAILAFAAVLVCQKCFAEEEKAAGTRFFEEKQNLWSVQKFLFSVTLLVG
jgi:hypothetical protein